MNNHPNGVNQNVSQPVPPVQTSQQPQPQPQQYYQPPSYYPPQYGTPASAPNGYYSKKQDYSLAAQKALESMNMPLFLILSIVFGWVCGRTIMTGHVGVGMTVMGILFYALFLPLILHRQQKKIPLSALLLFIPQIAIFASFALYSGGRNKICGLLISFIIVAVQTTLIAGCTEGRPFSRELLADVCSTYLAYPFLNLADTVKAVIHIGKSKNDGKKDGNAVKVLIGLVISIPVVIVLIVLLCRADQMFSVWVDTVIRLLNINLGRIMADILLTLIAMLYVMPLVVSLRSGYHNQYVTQPVNRPLDAIITSTVLYAASLIYLVFVAVQFRYLFASGGHLPLGYTYAEYCRRGFFELVFVTAATAIVIAAVCMLTKQNEKNRLPGYTKAALLVISACGIVMTVSAAYRLIIYVREYGMTVARFNAALIIAFMAICILVMALKILFDRLKVSAVIGSALIILTAAYAIFNVDGFIAKYNVDRYLNGTSKQMDIDYIKYNLSAAAIPELDRLAREARNANVRSEAEGGIMSMCSYHMLCDDYPIYIADWTLDRQQARQIVKTYKEKYEKSQRTSDSGVSA